jgi:Holliday junction resolvase RusA-like endonuclease
MEPITVRVNLKPVPAARPRIPRYGKPYYPKTYKRWIDEATRDVPVYAGTPIDHPVRATVLFAIPRARTSKLIVPVGDGDNFEKSIYDLLTKKGYLTDDKWITSGTWTKRFLPFGTPGFTLITLTAETEEIDIL